MLLLTGKAVLEKIKASCTWHYTACPADIASDQRDLEGGGATSKDLIVSLTVELLHGKSSLNNLEVSSLNL